MKRMIGYGSAGAVVGAVSGMVLCWETKEQLDRRKTKGKPPSDQERNDTIVVIAALGAVGAVQAMLIGWHSP